jgi:phenylacetate-CoA ligase
MKGRKTFLPSISSEEELKKVQLEGLKWAVSHAYDNSEFYRKRFDEASIRPGDIRSLEDLSKLPFTASDDLRENYPFPLKSAPSDQIVRIHASSGTTGKRKVLCYTQKDIDDWADFFARCYEMAGATQEDRIQIAVGYGVWTAGLGFQLGCERLGAMAIPSGPGNLDMQCQLMEDLGATVLCVTSSMGLLMAEEIDRRGLRKKLALKRIIFGAEPSSDAMRQQMQNLSGVEIFEIYGLTELYGPGTAMECVKKEGLHYWADYYILEIVDPETLEPVSIGETGEIVVTTLRKEASPLIRYRTRDLSSLIPHSCSCGSILPMHGRILGRSDDMFIFRAVNIYPSHVEELLSNIEGLGSEYQIVLDRREGGKDYMTIKVERAQGGDKREDANLASAIEERIKEQILVSGKVEILSYGELPRTDRKTKRIFDNR